MTDAVVEVDGYLDAADTQSTRHAVQQLGADVAVSEAAHRGAHNLRIAGIGLRGPGERAGDSAEEVDVGNAGTLLRLLPGWLAGQERGEWSLDGDE